MFLHRTHLFQHSDVSEKDLPVRATKCTEIQIIKKKEGGKKGGGGLEVLCFSNMPHNVPLSYVAYHLAIIKSVND